MSFIEVGRLPTRRAVRSGVQMRHRWRRVDRLLTASIGAAAVTAAVYLGVTAPISSPVQAPLPAAATVPQDTNQQGTPQQHGGRAADGGRPFGDQLRGGLADFAGGRR